MNVLLVYAHPCPESYVSAIRQTAEETLVRSGHKVEVLDLYADGFDPVLSTAERRAYHDESVNTQGIERYVDQLRRADVLLLVYPTWWYGMPAILKGWFDRIWVPGVGFKMPTGPNTPIRPGLPNIKQVIVLTTAGAPKWFTLVYMGHPAKKVLLRGIKLLCAPGAKGRWYCHYSMDSSTPESRKTFLAKVTKVLEKLDS